MQSFLARYSEVVGISTFRGKLYDVGHYPGAVPSSKATDRVRRDLYRLNDGVRVLRTLDEYEDCKPGGIFRREQVKVSAEDGKKIRAWIYLFNRPTNDLRIIRSGDYLKHIKAKRKING